MFAVVDDEMPQFASKSVAAINDIAIDDDTAADTSPQSNHDEVLHAAGYSVSHLTHGGSVGVVRHFHRDTQGFFEKFGNRHDTVPYEIGSILDVSGVIVAVRGTDTHTPHLIDAAHHVEGRLQSFDRSLHIVADVGIGFRFDDGLHLNRTTLVDDAEYGIRTAHIQTYDIRFLYCFHNDLYF